jgi:hypothetical protein
LLEAAAQSFRVVVVLNLESRFALTREGRIQNEPLRGS